MDRAHLPLAPGGPAQYDPGMRVRVGSAVVMMAAVIVAVVTPLASHASSVPACTTSHLRIGLGSTSSGLTHFGYPITFKNTGAACSMRGYPAVVGLGAGGRTAVTPKRSPNGYLGAGHRIATVTIAKGHTASAYFEGDVVDRAGNP